MTRAWLPWQAGRVEGKLASSSPLRLRLRDTNILRLFRYGQRWKLPDLLADQPDQVEADVGIGLAVYLDPASTSVLASRSGIDTSSALGGGPASLDELPEAARTVHQLLGRLSQRQPWACVGAEK